MTPSPSNQTPPPKPFFSQTPELAAALQFSGFALIGVYVVGVLAKVLPIGADIGLWGKELVGTLIGTGAFALAGVGFGQIGAALDPGQPLLERKARRMRELCLPAALGFLLLIPLHWHFQKQWRANAVSKAGEDVAAIQKAVKQLQGARSEEQLIQAMRELPGAPPIRDKLGQPFQQVQQTMLSQLEPQADAAGKQLEQRKMLLQKEARHQSLVASAMALCYGLAFLMLSPIGMAFYGARQGITRPSAPPESTRKGKQNPAPPTHGGSMV